MTKSVKRKCVYKRPVDEPRNREERRHPDLSALRKEMPPFVARNHPRFREWTGYSGRTLANLDAMKPSQGPSKRIMLGNVVAYERDCLIAWLEARSEIL